MSISRLLAICVFAAGLTAMAQTSSDPVTEPEQTPAPAPAPAPAQTPAPAPAPPAPPTWSVGPIDFSGLIDGYYTLNWNHPVPTNPAATNLVGNGGNQLYNFDVNANQFSLNMVKLSMAHSADPVGFQVDLGFGKAFEILHFAETGTGFLRNIEQAYVTLKPPKGKGFTVDFGQFVTSAGAEVIESNGNWNYSRSLLFSWAIPYYHFGIRLTQPFGSHFTGGLQVVNGWNNVEDNNTGKTLGLVGNFTGKKISWNNDFYSGPENTGSNRGFRNLYDTVLLLTPADKFNAYINFDYGSNGSSTPPTPTAKWYGIAGAAKIQLSGKVAITPRIEWFKDRDGFATGTVQELKEFTFTYEYKWVEGLLARIEYRRDWSDHNFFFRGATPNASDNQNTLALGIVAFFGPKR